MSKQYKVRATTLVFLSVLVMVAYLFGHAQAKRGGDSGLIPEAEASASSEAVDGWSPTQPVPDLDVYYPGSEPLEPDEMRIVALGTGQPSPRPKTPIHRVSLHGI